MFFVFHFCKSLNYSVSGSINFPVEALNLPRPIFDLCHVINKHKVKKVLYKTIKTTVHQLPIFTANSANGYLLICISDTRRRDN